MVLDQLNVLLEENELTSGNRDTKWSEETSAVDEMKLTSGPVQSKQDRLLLWDGPRCVRVADWG